MNKIIRALRLTNYIHNVFVTWNSSNITGHVPQEISLYFLQLLKLCVFSGNVGQPLSFILQVTNIWVLACESG